ncbi:MAG: ArsR/SmtB family transcription factor [Vulcanimicrobiaceae bacterium]
MSVTDLMSYAAVSQPAVSQHLRALQDARLITGRREGRNVYYTAQPRACAAREMVTAVRAVVAAASGPVGRLPTRTSEKRETTWKKPITQQRRSCTSSACWTRRASWCLTRG